MFDGDDLDLAMNEAIPPIHGTADFLLDALSLGSFDIRDAHLLVSDSLHHTVKVSSREELLGWEIDDSAFATGTGREGMIRNSIVAVITLGAEKDLLVRRPTMGTQRGRGSDGCEGPKKNE